VDIQGAETGEPDTGHFSERAAGDDEALQTRDLLQQLRSGQWDPANATLLEPLSASEFTTDLRSLYPVMFQERSVGRKHEIGLARSLRFEFAVRKHPGSLFTPPCLLPVLWRCLFVSSYEESISEITITSTVRVSPASGTRDVILKMGRGYKLDRTPDGWALKPLERRAVTLSEAFLAKRGWKFEALLPFCS
jgi:hypothetical protein